MVITENIEEILRSIYSGTIADILNTKTNPLLAKIRQCETDVWGKEVRRDIAYTAVGGIGAGDEDGGLPSSTPQKYLRLVSSLKNLYGRVEFSDKALIGASKAGADKMTSLINRELEKLLESSRHNLGRMLYGDGTGQLCKVEIYSTGLITVDSTRFLKVGMPVDVHHYEGAYKFSTVITTIDYEASTIRVETTTPIPNGYTLCMPGSQNKEITGLEAIFGASTSLYGVDRTNVAFLNPTRKTAVGELTERKMQETIDFLERSAGSTVNFITCSNDVKYAYQDHMSKFRQNIDIMELDGGYKSMSFSGIPMISDKFVPNGTMYMLDTDVFNLHQLSDWRFLEGESGKILRPIHGKAAYGATLVKYCELMCDRPCGQAKLSGITGA